MNFPLLCLLYCFARLHIVNCNLPPIRQVYAGNDAETDGFEITMRHPTKDQQNKWREELELNTPKPSGTIVRYIREYILRYFYNENISVKKFSTKSVGTEELDVIGEGNCLWRCFSYVITGNEENYMKIRKAIADYIRTGCEACKVQMLRKYGTMAGIFQFTGLENNVCDADEDVVRFVAMRFKVNIYLLQTEDSSRKTWKHFAPAPLEKLPEMKAPSILIRQTGFHNRVITDVNPSETLTVPNLWNVCAFTIEVEYMESFWKKKDIIPLVINPHDADVAKIESLIYKRESTHPYKDKLVFYVKRPNGEEVRILEGKKLGEHPYNYKCGTFDKIIGKIEKDVEKPQKKMDATEKTNLNKLRHPIVDHEISIEPIFDR